MRTKYPSIRETAAQILREVAAEEQIKTAERQMLCRATQRCAQTPLSQELIKLAEQCRHLADNLEISYDDLDNFVTQVNAGKTS